MAEGRTMTTNKMEIKLVSNNQDRSKKGNLLANNVNIGCTD